MVKSQIKWRKQHTEYRTWHL